MYEQRYVAILLISIVMVFPLAVPCLAPVSARTPYHGTPLSPAQTPLSNGQPHSGYLSGTGESETFYLDVPAFATSLTAILDGPDGQDFDLYGRTGSPPTTSTYDWRRGSSSPDESYSTSSVRAGRWYFMVYAYSGSGSFTLTVTFTFESAAFSETVGAMQTVRVAVYAEPNTTRPDYMTAGTLNGDPSAVVAALTSNNTVVSTVSTQDILEHRLTTRDFDVLVLPDQVPRESITQYVLDFWLGGGGVLSINSGMSYLFYSGILAPGHAGTDGYGSMWTYYVMDRHEVAARHPVTRNWQIGDSVAVSSSGWAVVKWPGFSSTTEADLVTPLAYAAGMTDHVSLLARRDVVRGGRAVHIGTPVSSVSTDIARLLLNAVDWLSPRAKARALFDLAHNPMYGVDPWDTMCRHPGDYSDFRNALVQNAFTIDKLYAPTVGDAITASTLGGYDVLFLVLPESEFTTPEVEAIVDWVGAGGALFVIGGYNVSDPAVMSADSRLSAITSSMGISVGTSGGDNESRVLGTSGAHVALDECSELSIGPHAYLSLQPGAVSLWNYQGMPVVACSTFHSGRLVMSGGPDWVARTHIGQRQNLRFVLNTMNWLTADSAQVLVLADSLNTAEDMNDNPFRGPVAHALNDIGLPYLLTTTGLYFRLMLTSRNWSLIIIDNPEEGDIFTTATVSALVSHLKAGHGLIVSTYAYSNTAAQSLWSAMGFTYVADFSSAPTVYPWLSDDPVLRYPHDFNGSAMIPTARPVPGHGAMLAPTTDSRAIAGSTGAVAADRALIVVHRSGRAIANGMLLVEFNADSDGSTGRDAYELWRNEIAFVSWKLGIVSLPVPTTTTTTPTTSTTVRTGLPLLSEADIPRLALLGVAFLGLVVVMWAVSRIEESYW